MQQLLRRQKNATQIDIAWRTEDEGGGAGRAASAGYKRQRAHKKIVTNRSLASLFVPPGPFWLVWS